MKGTYNYILWRTDATKNPNISFILIVGGKKAAICMRKIQGPSTKNQPIVTTLNSSILIYIIWQVQLSDFSFWWNNFLDYKDA